MAVLDPIPSIWKLPAPFSSSDMSQLKSLQKPIDKREGEREMISLFLHNLPTHQPPAYACLTRLHPQGGNEDRTGFLKSFCHVL